MTLRCLLVDDSPHFLGAAHDHLEREGIVVVGVATSITQALDQAQRLRPDVALVDIDLAGESGFELARRLREPGGPAVAAVILISTRAEEDFADLIAASPAVGFLAKTALSAQAIHGLVG